MSGVFPHGEQACKEAQKELQLDTPSEQFRLDQWLAFAEYDDNDEFVLVECWRCGELTESTIVYNSVLCDCCNNSSNITDGNPAGRLYRNRTTGDVWSLELEIGGSVWLMSYGVQMTCSMRDLSSDDWERVA